jgi:hypothetical protein
MCYTPNISLNFTVNETVTQISYVLDGKENVTVASNTILTNLPYGEHNVTVYATDIAGNVGSSETVIFTVAKPDPELEPFPTIPAFAVSAVSIVVVTAAGLLLTRRRRRKEAATA